MYPSSQIRVQITFFPVASCLLKLIFKKCSLINVPVSTAVQVDYGGLEKHCSIWKCETVRIIHFCFYFSLYKVLKLNADVTTGSMLPRSSATLQNVTVSVWQQCLSGLCICILDCTVKALPVRWDLNPHLIFVFDIVALQGRKKRI